MQPSAKDTVKRTTALSRQVSRKQVGFVDKNSGESGSDDADEEDDDAVEENDAKAVVQEKSVIFDSEDSEAEAAVVKKGDKHKDKATLKKEVSEQPGQPDERKEEAVDWIPMVVEGELVVKTQQEGGKFGNDKAYFAKFFIGGQFLAFFSKQDSSALAVFYIKLKDMVTIEDMFNADVKQVLVEYKQGKKETSIVLFVDDPKVKDKWYNALNKYKNDFEYMAESAEGDFGLSETEMKYLLTELFESGLTRVAHEDQAGTVRLRLGPPVRLLPHDQPGLHLPRGQGPVRDQQRLPAHVLRPLPLPARRSPNQPASRTPRSPTPSTRQSSRSAPTASACWSCPNA